MISTALRPGGAEVQRGRRARSTVDDAAVHEQRAPLVGIAQRGVAALLGLVVGLGLDDAGRQPQAVDAMPDHLAQEVARQLEGVAVENIGRPALPDGIALPAMALRDQAKRSP